METMLLATAPAAGSMGAILNDVTTFFHEVTTSYVPDVLSTITGNAYLMVGVCCMIGGYAVSLIGKIIRKA